MLTRRQHQLLSFINGRVRESGVSPSYDEMKDALDLASKSGVHRIVEALEGRGFIRRMPNRARAIEILRIPESVARQANDTGFLPSGVDEHLLPVDPGTSRGVPVPVMGRIAAGTPAEAIQTVSHTIVVPPGMLGPGRHFALEVQGDSMVGAGILDGDTVLVREQDTATPGDIVVALVDASQATLKRFRRRDAVVVLESANPAYPSRELSPDRVRVQGRMVGLLRNY